MKTFLSPLTPEEEKECIERMKEGDLKAKHQLIEHNLRLVAHVAKKYQASDEDMEDLISIGTIGLIKAVGTFKTDKQIKLATYAARCIDNELLMYFRGKKKTSREVSLYEPIGTDKEGNQINLLDIAADEEVDVVEKMEECENIRKLYGYLPQVLTDREEHVIAMRYGVLGEEPHTQREVAATLGISRSYVSRIEKKAWEEGGGNVPIQRFADFCTGTISVKTGNVTPNIKGKYVFGNVRNIFPPELAESIESGIRAMGKKIKDFDHDDVILSGVESRTSSPVKIFRKEDFTSSFPWIYPCGEGAGYAGGITSAAMDGMKVAEAIIKTFSAPDSV